jgi:phosphoribosylamine--glycine ligase
MFWAGRNRLFERTLGRLEAWLATEGYVGSIDLNCIVNETGIYPLEFTPRFGYPTIALQEESFEIPTGGFFYDLARGDDPGLRVHGGYQVGVRIVLPPFPFDDPKTYDESSRNAAVVFETESREGIHIEDAKNVEGQWRVAGDSGMPLVVTGKGETMQEARTACYDRIDDIVIPNLYYRDDIGERWIDGDGDRLLAWGYLGPNDE